MDPAQTTQRIISNMEQRRLTIFPRAADLQELTPFADEADRTSTSGSKRTFSGHEGPIHLRLPKAVQKVFKPSDQDPQEFYECIYIVDPEGENPYALAQEVLSPRNESALRVVMIRRSTIRAIVGTSKPNANLLNIVRAFHYNGSIFTVLDRPGLPLSALLVPKHPCFGVEELRTVSREVQKFHPEVIVLIITDACGDVLSQRYRILVGTPRRG